MQLLKPFLTFFGGEAEAPKPDLPAIEDVLATLDVDGSEFGTLGRKLLTHTHLSRYFEMGDLSDQDVQNRVCEQVYDAILHPDSDFLSEHSFIVDALINYTQNTGADPFWRSTVFENASLAYDEAKGVEEMSVSRFDSPYWTRIYDGVVGRLGSIPEEQEQLARKLLTHLEELNATGISSAATHFALIEGFGRSLSGTGEAKDLFSAYVEGNYIPGATTVAESENGTIKTELYVGRFENPKSTSVSIASMGLATPDVEKPAMTFDLVTEEGTLEKKVVFQLPLEDLEVIGSVVHLEQKDDSWYFGTMDCGVSTKDTMTVLSGPLSGTAYSGDTFR